MTSSASLKTRMAVLIGGAFGGGGLVLGAALYVVASTGGRASSTLPCVCTGTASGCGSDVWGAGTVVFGTVAAFQDASDAANQGTATGAFGCGTSTGVRVSLNLT